MTTNDDRHADTPENQRVFPQVKSVKKGLGFPVMRAVGLISLATGAVVDFAFAAHEGRAPARERCCAACSTR